jgi:hypothetical protein
LQFCRQARGSLYEMIEHFHTALDENYLDDNTQATSCRASYCDSDSQRIHPLPHEHCRQKNVK